MATLRIIIKVWITPVKPDLIFTVIALFYPTTDLCNNTPPSIRPPACMSEIITGQKNFSLKYFHVYMTMELRRKIAPAHDIFAISTQNCFNTFMRG